MPLYARYRVPFAWLIDPLRQTLEAYRLAGEIWESLDAWRDDQRAAAPPFEAVELALGSLWN